MSFPRNVHLTDFSQSCSGSSSFSSVPSYVLNIDMIIAKFRSAVKSKKIPDLSKTLINELYFTTEKKSAIIKEVQVLQGWGLFL